jgi:hypothetical protein
VLTDDDDTINSSVLKVFKGSESPRSLSGRWIGCFTKSGHELLMDQIRGDSTIAEGTSGFTFSPGVWAFWL